MPVGPITPGSPVDVTPDASPVLYRKIQAPSPTMPVVAADVEDLTLALINAVNAINIPQYVMKASNWFNYSVPTSAANLRTLIHDTKHGVVVAAGDVDKIYYASESLIASGANSDWQAGAFSSAQSIILRWGASNPTAGYLIVGALSGTKMYRSIDGGANWSTITLPITQVACTGPAIWDPVHAQFIMCGNDEVATSPTGAVWTQTAAAGIHADGRKRAIAADDSGNYLALGTGSFVHKSTDGGATWVTHDLPAGFSSGNLKSVGWSTFDQQWIVIGDSTIVGDSRVATSPDGVTWTMQPLIGASMGDLAIDGALYVATMTTTAGVGIAYSVDLGVTWYLLFLRDQASGWAIDVLTHFRGAFYTIGLDNGAGAQVLRSLRTNLAMTDYTP